MKSFNKYNLILIFILILLLNNCIEKVNKKSTDIDNIPKMVMNAHKSSNETYFIEICNKLNDSIMEINDLNYNLQVATHLNYVNENVSIALIELKEDLWYSLPDFERLTLFLDISNKSDILVNQKKIGISDLKGFLKKYLFELDSTYKKIAKMTYYSNMFGEIATYKSGVVLSNDARNRQLSITEWKVFFECLSIIVEVFDEQKNKLSLNKTGKQYNSLTFEQKIEFSKFSGYNIILNFDQNKTKNSINQKY